MKQERPKKRNTPKKQISNSIIWNNFKQGGTHKLVMLAIEALSKKNGYAYPSVQTLADMCSVSERQARYALSYLVKAQYLLITNNTHGGKSGATRHYQINYSMLSPAIHCPPTGEEFSRSKQNLSPAIHCPQSIRIQTSNIIELSAVKNKIKTASHVSEVLEDAACAL